VNATASHARILIVDDERTIRMVAALAFEDMGWSTETCASSEEALPRLSDERFDLLVADKNMPGMDGLALVRELRARGDAIPVIVMTGYASPESAAETLNLGVRAYLEKPFRNIFELPRAAARALQKPRPAWHSPAAHPAAAQATGSLRLLVIGADAAARRELSSGIDTGRDALDFAAPEQAVSKSSDALDVAIVDGRGGAQEAVDVLALLRLYAPELPGVLVADRVDVKLVRQLIELDALALLDGRSFGERIGPLLDRLRAGRGHA
jgi:CheY-like chemotaxis protein